MKDKELKLCPFCGALEEMIGDNKVIKHSPECFLYKYCATMYIYDERKDKWNTRTSPIQETGELVEHVLKIEVSAEQPRPFASIRCVDVLEKLDTLEKE